jgi:hypothetical protein
VENQLQEKQENSLGQEVEEVAKDLQINLPSKDLPIVLKLIAYFTLIGGLSIIGSLFSDIVRPTESSNTYFLRIAVGILSIVIGWAILERRRLALWLYGLIVFTGFFTNPIITILPLAVLVYLYIQRAEFTPSIFDNLLVSVITFLKSLLKTLLENLPKNNKV